MKYILSVVSFLAAAAIFAFVLFNPATTLFERFSPSKSGVEGAAAAKLVWGHEDENHIKIELFDENFKIDALNINVSHPEYALIRNDLKVENRRTFIVLDKTKADWHEVETYEVSEYRTGKSVLIFEDESEQTKWMLYYFVDSISMPDLFFAKFVQGRCTLLYKFESGMGDPVSATSLNLKGEYRLNENLSRAKLSTQAEIENIEFHGESVLAGSETIDNIKLVANGDYIAHEGGRIFAVQYFVGSFWNEDNAVELKGAKAATAYEIVSGEVFSGYVVFKVEYENGEEFYLSHFNDESSKPPYSHYFCLMEHYD